MQMEDHKPRPRYLERPVPKFIYGLFMFAVGVLLGAIFVEHI